MYKLVSINHDRYSFHCMQLSWIRQRDLHVLTHATVSYTSEKRFSVHHNLPNDDWELRISSTEARDAGFYECQVNTEPKLHWPIYLQVYSKFLSIAHHQPLVYHHQSIIPDYEEQLGAFILILVYRLWLPQLPPPSLSLSLSLSTNLPIFPSFSQTLLLSMKLNENLNLIQLHRPSSLDHPRCTSAKAAHWA